MRTKFIAGNWKMNLTKTSSIELARAIAKSIPNNVEVGIAPPFVYIDAVASEDCGRLLTSYTIWMPWFFSGNERMRLPVAAKYAFSTAGAATQTVGSPTPPQKPPEGMMIDSILGICAMRIES